MALRPHGVIGLLLGRHRLLRHGRSLDPDRHRRRIGRDDLELLRRAGDEPHAPLARAHVALVARTTGTIDQLADVVGVTRLGILALHEDVTGNLAAPVLGRNANQMCRLQQPCPMCLLKGLLSHGRPRRTEHPQTHETHEMLHSISPLRSRCQRSASMRWSQRHNGQI